MNFVQNSIKAFGGFTLGELVTSGNRCGNPLTGY